jgi:hypothetical protein
MSTTLHWTHATPGHELALDGTVLRCRKAGGQVLSSVPRAVRASRVGEELSELRERLLRHEAQCRSTVESWLLAGVPVPAALLARVWPDPGWRSCLEHLVVIVDGQTGLLTEISEQGHVTLMDLDGATFAPSVGPVTLPHPILLDDIDQWRKLSDSRDAAPGVSQLDRRIHDRSAGTDLQATGVDDYAGSRYEQLRHATTRAAENGFIMRGGFAVLRVAGGGRVVEARFWLGADDPGLPATTGRLLWVDAGERPVPLGEVGPVAWSEGVRMAELIHTGGQIDEQ